jgi:hypothetical protein
MGNILEEVRGLASDGMQKARQEREEREAQERKERLQKQEEARQWVAHRLSSYIEDIQEAARKGRRSVDIQLTEWDTGESLAWAERKGDELANSLRKEGFSAKSETIEHKPFGSDPIVPYTSYEVIVSVQW